MYGENKVAVFQNHTAAILEKIKAEDKTRQRKTQVRNKKRSTIRMRKSKSKNSSNISKAPAVAGGVAKVTRVARAT